VFAGLVGPRHERAKVITVLLDHRMEGVDVVHPVPAEHDADVVDGDAIRRTTGNHHRIVADRDVLTPARIQN
jgi:hypothetical protein